MMKKPFQLILLLLLILSFFIPHISLGDLYAQTSAEEGEEAWRKKTTDAIDAIEVKWAKYLSGMKKAYSDVESYERRYISKELKIAAWEKFVRVYDQDHPLSREDEGMREEAKKRMAALVHGDSGPVEGMVFIRGGCYEMGDTFGDGEINEKPVHEVCVDDFQMGKSEVTVGAFRAFVAATGYRTEAETDGGCYYYDDGKWKKDAEKNWRRPGGFSQTDKDPVGCVSWNDATKYVSWKKKTTGKGYRLPTEAEWEYAARSGGKKEKYAGISSQSALGDYAWYRGNANKKSHPVGEKRPNGLGLYDMTGNVWEWVSDWHDNYKLSPTGPSGGPYRVLRGGSWSDRPQYLRASYRYGGTPSYRVSLIGFRLAQDN